MKRVPYIIRSALLLNRQGFEGQVEGQVEGQGPGMEGESCRRDGVRGMGMLERHSVAL